jgi:hypothetical protein
MMNICTPSLHVQRVLRSNVCPEVECPDEVFSFWWWFLGLNRRVDWLVGDLTQKNIIIIVTAMKILDLTRFFVFF